MPVRGAATTDERTEFAREAVFPHSEVMRWHLTVTEADYVRMPRWGVWLLRSGLERIESALRSVDGGENQ